jgi:hypothetical protein
VCGYAYLARRYHVRGLRGVNDGGKHPVDGGRPGEIAGPAGVREPASMDGTLQSLFKLLEDEIGLPLDRVNVTTHTLSEWFR